MADYTRFMILAGPRTGSTMLASSLNSHPNIVCFREVFSFTLPGINYGVDGYDGRDERDLAFRERDPLGFLHRRIYGGHPSGIQAAGFKFLYPHVYGYTDVGTYLQEDTEIRVVHLLRRNVIRTLVSRKIADTTGLWGEEPGSNPRQRASLRTRLGRAMRHPGQTLRRRFQRLVSVRKKAAPLSATNSAGGNPATTVSLTEKECRDELWKQALMIGAQDEKWQAHPYLTVYYEDVVADAERALGEVQEFLDVEPRPLAPTTLRQNPQPLRELIENYDEIREAFRDTEYAWMLEE